VHRLPAGQHDDRRRERGVHGRDDGRRVDQEVTPRPQAARVSGEQKAGGLMKRSCGRRAQVRARGCYLRKRTEVMNKVMNDGTIPALSVPWSRS
jgi:hypothetical protein